MTRYLLDRSPDLIILSLSIDWPEPTLCNLLPDPIVDFLGTSYLKEVLQGNSLAKVREVHLLSQFSRGQKLLNKEFAQFVMKNLPSLRHMGNFNGWNITERRKRVVRMFPVMENLDISIHPDSPDRPSEFAGQFSKIFSGDQFISQ